MGKVISLPARARPASRSLLLLLLGTIRGFSKVVWITLPLAVAVIFNCKDFLVIFFYFLQCHAWVSELFSQVVSPVPPARPRPRSRQLWCEGTSTGRASAALGCIALLSSGGDNHPVWRCGTAEQTIICPVIRLQGVEKWWVCSTEAEECHGSTNQAGVTSS